MQVGAGGDGHDARAGVQRPQLHVRQARDLGHAGRRRDVRRVLDDDLDVGAGLVHLREGGEQRAGVAVPVAADADHERAVGGGLRGEEVGVDAEREERDARARAGQGRSSGSTCAWLFTNTESIRRSTSSVLRTRALSGSAARASVSQIAPACIDGVGCQDEHPAGQVLVPRDADVGRRGAALTRRSIARSPVRPGGLREAPAGHRDPRPRQQVQPVGPAPGTSPRSCRAVQESTSRSLRNMTSTCRVVLIDLLARVQGSWVVSGGPGRARRGTRPRGRGRRRTSRARTGRAGPAGPRVRCASAAARSAAPTTP